MAKKRFKLIIAGETDTGEVVVDNIFRAVDTYGVPLDIVLVVCKDSGITVNWVNFILMSIKANWKLESTIISIIRACTDVYGANHADEVSKRIELLRQYL